MSECGGLNVRLCDSCNKAYELHMTRVHIRHDSIHSIIQMSLKNCTVFNTI